ncbi:hypothetical protein JKP88DRAFT_273570 [Tribonema minus]|uniref:F-box domain-containing protein n=1 Tax=Tribonema minus TaxID=303371 RepID=A0A835YTG0_9STRA|nr:hypothetical protein JKP88DRAFT_273570 [Tribonema minus]
MKREWSVDPFAAQLGLQGSMSSLLLDAWREHILPYLGPRRYLQLATVCRDWHANWLAAANAPNAPPRHTERTTAAELMCASLKLWLWALSEDCPKYAKALQWAAGAGCLAVCE